MTLEMTVNQLADGLTIEPADSLMAEVVSQVMRGFDLVDRVYELSPNMPKYGQTDWERDEVVIKFAMERAREAARFTASLYLTAWRKSANVKMPGYHSRSFDTEKKN